MIYLALIILGICAIWFVSGYIASRRKPTGDDYDAAELSGSIEKLHELSEQLAAADRMLGDLDACNPHSLLRGFRVNWFGIDGKRRWLDFFATGINGATTGLRTAAREQRDEINAEIIQIVRAMAAALDTGEAPALRLDGVDETVDETSEEMIAGEG